MTSPETELFERLRGVVNVTPTAPSENSEAEQEMAREDPDFSKPVSIRNIFTHHDTHPVVMDFALLKAFGMQWLEWEPETIWSEIQRIFKSQISEHARSKIHALRALRTSNMPWEKWQVFEKVIQALNNNIPRWAVMQAPTLEQLYVGIDIIDEMRSVDFSDEVKAYIAAAVLHDDVTFVPPPLDFVQVEVSHPYYRCKDCGNEDLALFHDGTCDTCTLRFSPEQGLSFLPDPDRVRAGKGKNVELLLKFDPNEVQARWEAVKTQPTSAVVLEETACDTQVAKLLVARDYLNVRRRQLAEQLTNLRSWLESSR